MAESWGVKYKMTYYDQYGELNEVYFRERGYVGSQSSIRGMGRSPGVLQVNSPSKDPYKQVLRGTTAVFTLEDDTGLKYEELMKSDGKKYHVQWDKDSTLYWAGWVTQGAFQNPYSIASYGVGITCTDGIATLRNYQVSLTGKQSLMEVLAHCLGNIRASSLPVNALWENLDKYEEHHDTGNSDSPLTQTYIDCDDVLYDDEGEGMACYDAINQLFLSWGVMLRQSQGEWELLQISIMAEEYRRRKFTLSAGSYSYDSNELHDPVVTTTGAVSLATINVLKEGGDVQALDALKKYTITQMYGKRDGFLLNQEFKDWTAGVLDDWMLGGSITIRRLGDKARITPSASGYLQQEITLDMSSFQKLRINMKYVIGESLGHDLTFVFELMIINSGITYYYDFENQYWATPVAQWSKVYDEATTEDLELLSGQINTGVTPTGTLRLKIKVLCNDDRDFFLDECFLRLMEYDTTSYDTTEFVAENKQTVGVNPHNNLTTTYESLASDTPEIGYYPYGEPVLNEQLIYKNILLYLDSTYDPTFRWLRTELSSDGYDTLINKVITEITRYRSEPRMRVRSDLMSNNVFPGTIIEDQFLTNDLGNARRFMILEGEYDSLNGEWKGVELLEMYSIEVDVPQPLEDSAGVMYDEDGAMIG